MEIVINIPDEQIEKSLVESKYIHENEGEKGSVNIVLLYTNKKLEFVDISRKTDFYSLTDKYTVLPKGHGRLIECEPIYDKLIRSYRADEKDYPERGKDYRVGLSNAIDLLITAPTIIEGSESE